MNPVGLDPGAGEGGHPERCRAGILELAAVTALLFAEFWLFRPIDAAWPATVATYACIVGVIVRSYFRRAASRSVPRLPAPSRHPWALMLGVSFLLLLGLFALGALLQGPQDRFELRFTREPWLEAAEFLSERFAQAALQQVALHAFLGPVCRELFRREWVALTVAAAIFAVIHLPGATAVGVTFVAGWAWLWVYPRTEKLLALCVLHAALVVLLQGIVPPRYHYGLRVGFTTLVKMERFAILHDPGVQVLVAEITSDQRFAEVAGDDRAWIRAAYRDVFGREAPDVEVAGWVAKLETASHLEVARALVTSDESRRARGYLEQGRGN